MQQGKRTYNEDVQIWCQSVGKGHLYHLLFWHAIESIDLPFLLHNWHVICDQLLLQFQFLLLRAAESKMQKTTIIKYMNTDEVIYKFAPKKSPMDHFPRAVMG